MSDWEQRVTHDASPARRVEDELRYALVAPLVREASLWVDLGSGTGVAAADGLGSAAPRRAVLVDTSAHALEQAARELGFATADARRLAYATVAGAMTLAQQSDADPAALRAQVTSKGGTTERALATLEKHGVKVGLVAAVKAAAERAHELGDEFGKER